MPTSQSSNSIPVELSPIPAPATTAAHPELLPAARGHPLVIIKPPGRYMDVADRRLAPTEEDTTKAEDENETTRCPDGLSTMSCT